MREARDKSDPCHIEWLHDIAAYCAAFLAKAGFTVASAARAARLDETKFGYLGKKDRLLLQDAIFLQSDAFLTMERRLPRNADHIEHELGIRILTPMTHWRMLRPWAALWV